MTEIEKFVESLLPEKLEINSRCPESVCTEVSHNKCREQTKKLILKAFDEGKIWRAVGEEKIKALLLTWEKNPEKEICCSSCEQDKATGYGEDIESCCCRHQTTDELAQAIIRLLSKGK